MARILGSHSALAVPPSEFLFFGKGGLRAPASRPEFERRLAEILRWPRVREWGLDEGDLLARSRSWPPTMRSLFLLPLDAYRRRLGRSRIGEKSVLNEFRRDVLDRWFGDYRLVQMIRHPLAGYASTYAGRKPDVRRAVRWGRLWTASAALGRDGDPTRHRLVRYEDLTAAPREVIASVCEFVGVEPEEDAMLSLKGYSEKENSSFAASETGTYEGAIRRSDRVDRRGVVEPRERAALAATCGWTASALGYELEGRPALTTAAALALEWARPRTRLRSLVAVFT